MLTDEEAITLVAASRLFDEQWYADQVGRSFTDRADAVRHWVTERAPGSSPHALVEPDWLYPGGRWRKDAPDPLSYLLTHPEKRSPHPRYPQDELGPLAVWLATHSPGDLPPLPVPDATEPVLVRVDGGDLRLAVRWLRHLHRHAPHVGVKVTGLSPAGRRILAGVVGRPDARVEVDVDAGLAPPPWAWLAPLLETVGRDGVAAAQPLLVDEHVVVNGPVGIGLPVSAVERWDGRGLPARIPGALASRTGAVGDAVLATGSWLVGPRMAAPDDSGDAYAGFAPAATVLSGAPPLRWSIDIAAPAAPLGRRWGDWHFARSLADALERLGQVVVIDHPETRGRPTRADDDVVLVLRGLDRVNPTPGAVNLLWVISHPAEVTPTELASFDLAFAAGTAWARARGAIPLLQCTDATRFHPGLPLDDDGDGEVLFVGNARGGMRPAVAAAREAGVPLTVIGGSWDRYDVPVEATRLANTALPARYAAAGVVLNDHHDDMRLQGFVSNRVFDVLAVGGRLLGDDVAGLADALGVELPVWHTPADVARLATPPYDAWGTGQERRALAERVVAEHSFDARAATLLDAARRLVDSRG